MPGSVAGRSAASAKERGPDIIEAGPTTINGVVYMKTRRCPCCRLTNTDPNPVTRGPLAISKTVLWNKGTSTSPEGRLDRVCFIAFTQGGFADQFEDLYAFVNARKENRSLMEEWNAAYDRVIEMAPDLPERLGKVVTEKLGEILVVARKQRVDAFKKTQKRVATSYRAVRRSAYEKKYPGKIVRKGLTCKTIAVDGGKQVEVVLIRKLPKDEWDLTYEDVSGVAHTEEYDTGDINVRANQAAVKFQSIANKTSLTKGDLDGVAADGDTSDTSADGDDLEAGMSESDPSDQDEDVAYSMVTASLLDDVHLNTKRQDSHPLPLRKSSSSKPPAVSSASTRTPASSLRASPKASKSSNGSLIGASTASASASDAGGADEGGQQVAGGKKEGKFQGKSAEEILSKHGHAAHRMLLDEILTIMKQPCFDSMLTGGSLGHYINEVEGLRRKTATLLRGSVNLDIKVKKWRDIPERVSCVLGTDRGRAKALTDAFAAFAGVTKNNDSQRMEVAKAALEIAGIPVPKAFHVLFFKEQACDFIRFRRLDNFTTHIRMDGGGYIKEGMFSETDNLTDLIADTIADALKMMVQGCIEQSGAIKISEAIGELTGKIIGCPTGLPQSAVSDLTLVYQAVGSVAEVSDRSSALITLLSMMNNEGPGVLMPMLREPSCRVLLTFLQNHYKSTQPCQETMCSNNVARHA